MKEGGRYYLEISNATKLLLFFGQGCIWKTFPRLVDTLGKLRLDFDAKIDKMKSSLMFDILITAKALELPLWEFEIMEFIKNKNKTVGQIRNRHSKKFEAVVSPCSKMKF